MHITFTLTFIFRVFSRRFYRKRHKMSTFVREREKIYIAVGTLRMFMEPSALTKH